MIENIFEIAPLVRAGETSLVLWKVETGAKILGLHIERGHVAVRKGHAFPVIGGKTCWRVFEEDLVEKSAGALDEPLHEVGELSSVVFVPGALNYYHFLAFNLPALCLLSWQQKERPVLAMTRGFPASARTLMPRLLSHFSGGRDVAITNVTEGDYVARDVVFRARPVPHVIATMARTVQDLVLAGAGIANPLHDPGAIKLFVPRRGALNGRNLANHDEVQSWLERRGYVAIDPGALTMEEQVILFSRATHVVGVEGAAMANVLFAANARAVVVLANPLTRDDSFFGWIGGKLSFATAAVFGKITGREPPSRASDFVIDLKDLDDAFRRLDL